MPDGYLLNLEFIFKYSQPKALFLVGKQTKNIGYLISPGIAYFQIQLHFLFMLPKSSLDSPPSFPLSSTHISLEHQCEDGQPDVPFLYAVFQVFHSTFNATYIHSGKMQET